MARPKKFDRDTALGEAIKAFSDRGFEGTSTDALLLRMGISRQSMYDTFGDKRRLYLEALQRYFGTSTAEIIGTLHAHASPAKGLQAALLALAMRPADQSRDGCLGVSAISEFGRSDAEISAITDAAAEALLAALETVIRKGQDAGELTRDIDARHAARLMSVTLSGLKVSARAGVAPAALRASVELAMRGLKWRQ